MLRGDRNNHYERNEVPKSSLDVQNKLNCPLKEMFLVDTFLPKVTTVNIHQNI